MLKVRINNLAQPTDVYVWLTNMGGSDKLNLLATFHATEAEAIENKGVKTDKNLQWATKMKPNITILMPTVFSGIAGLTTAVHEGAKAYILALGLTNITSITII